MARSILDQARDLAERLKRSAGQFSGRIINPARKALQQAELARISYGREQQSGQVGQRLLRTPITNIGGHMFEQVRADIPRIARSTAKFAPPVTAYSAFFNKQALPQPSDVYQSLKGVGYLTGGPLGLSIGGTLGLGFQGISNKLQGEPFLKNYGQSFARGVSQAAPYLGIGRLNPLNAYQATTRFRALNPAIMGAVREGAEGVIQGLIRPLEKGETRLQAVRREILYGAAFGAAMDSASATWKLLSPSQKELIQKEIEGVLINRAGRRIDATSKQYLKEIKDKVRSRWAGEVGELSPEDSSRLDKVLDKAVKVLRDQGGFIKFDEFVPKGKAKGKLPLPQGVEGQLRTEIPAALKGQITTPQVGKVVSGGGPSQPILAQQKKYAFNINKPRLGLRGEAAKKLDAVVEQMRPVLEERKGAPLGNKEIIREGRKAVLLDQVLGREEAANFSSRLQASRNFLRTASKERGITPEYLAQLEIVSSTAADTGRRLRAFSVGAEDAGIKQEILKDLKKLGIRTKQLIAAGKNVDWNDASQVTAFYRKFKPATFLEQLEEFRYTNMLSSPNTHIINFFTNFLQTGIVAPIEKTLTGQLDWVRSKLTGTEQQYFARQGIDYTKAYYSAFPEAWRAFKNTVLGAGGLMKPDIDFIPTGTSKLHREYTTPLRMLEAGDQFFRTMAEKGELATGATPLKAKQAAQYRLFRQQFDPTGKYGQGIVLQTWDKWNSAVQNMRRMPGGKWIVPFLQTPTNILKQGVEYSPLGATTIPGAKEPMVQLAKTMMGSTVFLGAYAMAKAGLTTFEAPVSEKEKSNFYAAGLQPYSIKIGDKWISYSKLGPFSYPLVMAAALKWGEENKADEDVLRQAGKALVGFLKFFSDQSYVRGIGDWVDAARGDEFELLRAMTNIPSQIIPYRAFQGWLARIVDNVYRKPSGPIESLMTQVPFLSKQLEPYTTPTGEPSLRHFPMINAFSPLRITQEQPTGMRGYQTFKTIQAVQKGRTKVREEATEKAQQLFDEWDQLPKAEANAKYRQLKKTDPQTASKIKSLVEEKTLNYTSEEKSIKALGVEDGTRAQYIYETLNQLPKAEANAKYRDWRKRKIITDQVHKQILELIGK